ncbi:VOC family protein [Soonwooa sp.]|uniref:VOC family protein n=1 Tax=Soonwooa sp. TaxID=1938592 RepID=UPI00260D1CC4|nr:VOC family protein [Soonwooa sp.]
MINSNIFPCFWFDGKANEAAQLYTDVFPNAVVTVNSPVVVNLEINGQKLMLLNGGPMFQPNPSVSIMVMCETDEEVENYYNKLSPDGKVLMELNSYPWSDKFAWINDKFGVSWQFYKGDKMEQKYVPTLMFVQENNGKCREAMNFYTSIFPNSKIDGILEHTEASGDLAGMVAHAWFVIDNYSLYAMDCGTTHDFSFTEGASIVVMTADQEETDKYWNALTSDGGQESQCGWLKDKYNLSWQIVPHRLIHLMNDPNREKSQKVVEAMLKMKKIIIADLEAAYNS